MRRKLPSDKVASMRAKDRDDRPVRMLATWAADNSGALRSAPDPELPTGLNDRQGDNWTLLLQIADYVGRGDIVRRACAELCTGRSDDDHENVGILLLGDARAIIGNAETISSASLLSGLEAIEEHPWLTWNRKGGHKPINTRQLARLLRPFGIESKLIRAGANVFRGYTRGDFADAWTRYLPPESTPEPPSESAERKPPGLPESTPEPPSASAERKPPVLPENVPFSFLSRPGGVLSVTSVTSPESLDNSENSIRYKDDFVTDKNDEIANNINGVTCVTDKKPLYQRKKETGQKAGDFHPGALPGFEQY
jgi:hypothetical protein